MSNRTKLGKVAYTPRGEYAADKTYLPLDVVSYEGSSYVALAETTGVLPTDETYFALVAGKGDGGNPGKDGKTPVKGVDYFTDSDKADLMQYNVVYVNENDGSAYLNGKYGLQNIRSEVFNGVSKYRFFMYFDNGGVSGCLIPLSVRYNTFYGSGETYLELFGQDTNMDGTCRFIHGYWYWSSDYINWNSEDYPTDPNPCLIEGTLVQMADGTDKPIETVCAGDVVKSYNPATAELTDAVVIDAYRTGYSRKFDVYNFSGGQSLTVYGLHGIYRPARGTPQDIRELKLGAHAMDLTGGETVLIGKREHHFAGEKKARYNLLTSNNLYFAGGILLGNRASTKMHRILDHKINIPDDIKEVWMEDCTEYNAYNNYLSDPTFFDEIKEINRTVARHEISIKQNRKSLFDTDYLVNKFTEGVLDLSEWKKAKENRSSWRKAINDSEAILSDAKEKLNAAIEKRRGGKTPKSIFESCCSRDNAIYDRVLEYFSSLKGGDGNGNA